ncbi:MAG TPA: Rrf2 family transcriptional regulator [Thermoclostridium caenicola]|uniref:Transcriptional regulator, BadM/Rrf2 family n=1 Tax=Thermoclostridium caenicola TaxID=659425 RepID=A0A1M6AQV3_9FIRM|nr:Rrf2 family transcriptional regulator [Thermoclostridium caenicola]SHI38904.1 transcriptional regulator, BadM/Rrf2 family [Thermoclostridium caenicola]HOK42366.1 Rrf2 family transcriptional regulator [Thermoclostridium caenicola]HOL85058.1 Rrf2 family transcriptional regulator [Thermoclostridium caenicola]HPO77165.1 Rrf2 family transcriptional regulator [Thermoclostridium caenicola]
MRISAKGRYALAAAINMAENYSSGEYITVISISEKLGISKIYLEQVFSLLKRGGIVNSVKGAQGGYQLARSPRQVTVYDVLSAVETALFEPAEETVKLNAPEIDAAMRATVFDALDSAVKSALEKITLSDLVSEVEKHKADQGFMFFI